MKRFFCFVSLLVPSVLLLGAIGVRSSGTSAQRPLRICTVPGDYSTIQAAVDDPACDVVNIGAGTFRENVVISRTLTIDGQGPLATIVDGGGGGHVLTIRATTSLTPSVDMTVSLSDLTLANGDSGLYAGASNVDHIPGLGRARLYVSISHSAIRSNAGSGIRAYAGILGQTELSISDSDIFENLGEGISNSSASLGFARLEVINSTISSNSGGGISSIGCSEFCGASLLVVTSTIHNNAGSGIYNSGRATVVNTTISGNAARFGGGIYNCGLTNLSYSTISGNSAGSGGGLYIVSDSWFPGCPGQVTASNTIVANSREGPECELRTLKGSRPAEFDDLGHNIVEDGTCIDASTSSAGDPLLGPLADNGGRTMTHALLPGSPAIDAGDNAACPAADQRGRPRPEDGDEDGTPACDIGSYEARTLQEYADLPSFTGAAGRHLSEITFVDLEAGTLVTDQYLDIGAKFTDGDDSVVGAPEFVTDGMGVDGQGQVSVWLSKPAVAIGADHPGGLTIELYDQPGGTLLYASSGLAGQGVGFFSGVVTDRPFTYVVFGDWIDDAVSLDNIYFPKSEFKTYFPLVH
jgi:hypothetical protein